MSLFSPEQYITNNPQLFRPVQPNQPTESRVNSLFYLMSDTPGFEQRVYLGFPYIPEQISFKHRTEYTRIMRSMADSEDLHFSGNKADELEVKDLILSTRSSGVTFEPLIYRLRFIMKAQQDPTFFYIGIQGITHYPYVLTEMDYIETGWESGRPVEALISMKFIKSKWGRDLIRDNNSDIFFDEYKDVKEPEDLEDKEQPNKVEEARDEIEQQLTE